MSGCGINLSEDEKAVLKKVIVRNNMCDFESFLTGVRGRPNERR